MYPIFVDARISSRKEIESMPGIHRLPIQALPEEVDAILALKIPAVLVFGLPNHKDAGGSEAYARNGIVQDAVRTIKQVAPELVVATDVCLCQYTDHGHCGILGRSGVDNDETLRVLMKVAVSQAEAGADIVAPSAMMDGQVKSIRKALDEGGLNDTAIMAYSAKYASAFYGPFREAAESAPAYGDRRQHQMDPSNRREALREIALDVAEGADIIMVKPALAYLDVISEARKQFDRPIAAYNVSGEYAMIKAAARGGWVDEKPVVLEVLTALKRAGANVLITYFAKEAVEWLRTGA